MPLFSAPSTAKIKNASIIHMMKRSSKATFVMAALVALSMSACSGSSGAQEENVSKESTPASTPTPSIDLCAATIDAIRNGSSTASLAFSCENDLSDRNLSELKLEGQDLSGVNLSGANLHRTSLYKVDLRGANLQYADLTNASLTGADLRKADLRWANFTGASLFYANLAGALCKSANFADVDIHGANIKCKGGDFSESYDSLK